MSLRSERRFISLSKIEPGMLIQFTYKKLNGESGDYVVLVIDPNRKNEHAKEPQLHGYDIKNIDDEEVIAFGNIFRKPLTLTPDPNSPRKSFVEDINSDDAYEGYASSKFKSERPYRTFNISKMSQVRQILLGTPQTGSVEQK